MLLQRLVDLAERTDGPVPSMYQRRTVRYEIRLDETGRFLEMVDLAGPAKSETARGEVRVVPYTLRTSAIRAIAFADHGEYTLGISRPDGNAKKVAQRQETFRDAVRQCYEATAEPTVGAVMTFIESVPVGDPLVVDYPSDFDSTATMTFKVGDTWPTDLPAVQSFWSEFSWSIFEQESDEVADEAGTGSVASDEARSCFVCGLARPIAFVHPITIKRVPGGQPSGNYLLFGGGGPFWSYRLSGKQNVQVCRVCAEKYCNALNGLLASDRSSVRVGKAAYVFWVAEETGFNAASLLTDPDPEEVRELVRAAWTARAAATELDPTPFYSAVLSGAGSRVVIREWIDQTVGEAKRSLGRYFALQDLVDPYGEVGKPMPIRPLAMATVRYRSGDDAQAATSAALMALALRGTPLPIDVAFQVIRRCRMDGEITRERIALIKMVLGSQPGKTIEEITRMSDLDQTNPAPAYLCGRLLAVLDSIQYAALKQTNATVVDKFYGTASSAPGSVFGNLLGNAQPHLAKLRKERPGVQRALERRLEEVLADLPVFPKTLSLPDQGLFALGFYHQRAADRRSAREAKERGQTDVAEALVGGEAVPGAEA